MFDGAAPLISGDVNHPCTAMEGLIDELVAEDPTGLDTGEQLERLRRVGRLADRLRAEQVRLLVAADRSGALAEDGAATAAAWLRFHTTMTATEASAVAKVARRLHQLPVIAQALAAGEIGMAHAIAVDRLAVDVGVDMVEAVQGELVTAAARLRDVREFQRLCIGWRHALRPDLLDDADDRAYQSRRLSHSPTLDGRFYLNGSFDAEGGATIATALNAFMTHDAPDTPPELRRSVEQQRADALVELARRGLAMAGDVAGERPQVVVRVDLNALTGRPSDRPAELDCMGPIGPAMLERLVTDSALVRIVTAGGSQPLDVGTATRVWPTGIRRAITDRDRRCRFPGCDRLPAWCDIDHIIPVTDNGPTAVTNGILLCRHHHRAKRRTAWWPTLHDDCTVTWRHADGRTQIDPPPDLSDRFIDRLDQEAAHVGTLVSDASAA